VLLLAWDLYSISMLQVLSHLAWPRKAAMRRPMSRAFCEPVVVEVVEADICIIVSECPL
jgi:hypothetical protein